MARTKRTQAAILGQLEASRIAQTLGRDLRDGRRRRQLDQAELGIRVGLSQAQISQLEQGRGASLPLEGWVSLGLAIGQPLAVGFSRPVDDRLVDSGHLDIQEAVLGLLRRHRWTVRIELATKPLDPRHCADLAVRDRAGAYLLIEIWNTMRDLGAALRSSDRKAAELRGLAHDGDVRVCWIIRATAANREVVRRYPGLLRSRFPGSSRHWAAALAEGQQPPVEPGIVWWEGQTLRAVKFPGARP